MDKKNAFTLAEVVVCLVIIGVLATVMIKNLSTKSMDEKTDIAKALKAILTVEEATAKIIELDTTSCPTGSFITNLTGTPTYTFLNSANGNANATQVYNAYSNYIKFQNTTALNFCTYSGYCSDTAIKGGKIAGDIYLGFQVNASLPNCPNYYLPNSTSVSASRGDKCWGNLYIDINGTKGPNTLGNDVFVFGLNGKGLSK